MDIKIQKSNEVHWDKMWHHAVSCNNQYHNAGLEISQRSNDNIDDDDDNTPSKMSKDINCEYTLTADDVY